MSSSISKSGRKKAITRDGDVEVNDNFNNIIIVGPNLTLVYGWFKYDL
jgi:hypothetical protein